MEKKILTIYLDFDGTVTEHEYPKLGRFNPYALETIKELIDFGHDVILNTMRIEGKKEYFDLAISYINHHHRIIMKVEKYTNNKIHPTSLNWDEVERTNILYIDDSSIDTPLIKAVMTNGMMVDWIKMKEELVKRGYL